jgi:hypothetical protein
MEAHEIRQAVFSYGGEEGVPESVRFGEMEAHEIRQAVFSYGGEEGGVWSSSSLKQKEQGGGARRKEGEAGGKRGRRRKEEGGRRRGRRSVYLALFNPLPVQLKLSSVVDKKPCPQNELSHRPRCPPWDLSRLSYIRVSIYTRGR